MRHVTRWILTAFCWLAGLAWLSSLAVFSIDQIRSTMSLRDGRFIRVWLVVIAAEFVVAVLVASRIRKARDPLASIWTLGAVLGALVFSVFNFYAGVVNAFG